jgi:hypothetical protein
MVIRSGLYRDKENEVFELFCNEGKGTQMTTDLTFLQFLLTLNLEECNALNRKTLVLFNNI